MGPARRAVKSICPSADFPTVARFARANESAIPLQMLCKQWLYLRTLNWIIMVNCRYANVIRALGSLYNAARGMEIVDRGRSRGRTYWQCIPARVLVATNQVHCCVSWLCRAKCRFVMPTCASLINPLSTRGVDFTPALAPRESFVYAFRSASTKTVMWIISRWCKINRSILWKWIFHADLT